MASTLLLIFHLKFENANIRNIINNDEGFFLKVSYFEKFIKEKKSINLLLGSSIIEDLIIPDSLSDNWFSFTNAGQNIYNSYKFLKFYHDLVKIDTIIIGIQPFDFPYSYIRDRDNELPYLNYSFNIFGSDSITVKEINYGLLEIQLIKTYFFPNLKDIIIKDFEKNRLLSKQGFSGRNRLNIKDKFYERRAYSYFYNVKSKSNLEYFDLINDLSNSIGVKIIYLLTPKSKNYHLDLAKYEYDSIWNNILDSLETRNVQIWNYEKMNTDTFKLNWFWDDTHSSYDGAKAFTKIIRMRLRD